MWRHLLGACGGVRVSHPSPQPVPPCISTPLESATQNAHDPELLLAACSTISTNSCCARPVALNCATSPACRDSVAGCSASHLVDKVLLTSAKETSGGGRDSPASSTMSSYLTQQHTRASTGLEQDDSETRPAPMNPSPTVPLLTLPPGAPRPAIADGVEGSSGSSRTADALQVALSAYSIRDIAPCDPAMRIRQLRLLSYGAGTVVYAGAWQGLPIAVKFMLHRSGGGDAGGMLRRTSALLAAHCIPQRSHMARVYSCDVSEVVATGSPLQGGCTASDASRGCGAAPAVLTVRPCGGGGDDPDGTASPPPCMCSDDVSSHGSASSSFFSPGRRGSVSDRFHFSSVVFSEASACCSEGSKAAGGLAPASSNAGPPEARLEAGQEPTLQGLLQKLEARPGDFLLHSVMELASGGNLWHAIGSGVYDMHGRLGPLGAVRMAVHSARVIAQGMQQLHQAGDVHGGLTPANVLVHRVDDEPDDEGGDRARVLRKRRGFTARITDCGMRRLVLGSEWRRQLDANPELRCCSAPELLALAAEATAVEWAPSHDVYSFGALLHCMCTGSRPNTEGQQVRSAHRQHMWPPLRGLSEACMAPDPSLRPVFKDVVKALLVLEQRLQYSSRSRFPREAGPLGLGAGAAAGASRLRTAATVTVAGMDALVTSTCSGSVAHVLHMTAAEADGFGAAFGAASDAARNSLPSHVRPGAIRRFALTSMPEVLLHSGASAVTQQA